MGLILSIFEQVLLLSSLLLFTGFVFWNATHGTNSMELALRTSSLFAGTMVVVGAQAAGLSFASFTVDALSSTQPSAALASKIAGVILPGGIGAGMGWYLTRSLHKNQNIAMRIMAFVGMLAASQFAAIYVVATNRHGVRLGVSALPNIFFVVGILLYIMLKYDPARARQRRATAASHSLRRVPKKVTDRIPGLGSLVPPQAGADSSGLSGAFHEANEELRRTMNQPDNPGAG